MGLEAGNLRERIVLISTAGPPAYNGRGYVAAGADTEQSLWAQVRPLSVRESLLLGQVANAETYEITLRALHKASAKQRIRWQGKTLNIQGVRPAENREYQLLTCINGGQ